MLSFVADYQVSTQNGGYLYFNALYLEICRTMTVIIQDVYEYLGRCALGIGHIVLGRFALKPPPALTLHVGLRAIRLNLQIWISVPL